MNLEEAMHVFIEKQSLHPHMKAEAVHRLFFGAHRESVFLQEMGEAVQSEEIEEEHLERAIRESVRNYARNKDSAIEVYKQFISYLERIWNRKLGGISFPPIPVANTFERLMFLSKYLQDPHQKIEALEDILWVSARTIEGDLAKLRGRDNDPLQVCGKRYVIEEMSRDRGKVSFSSTPHPLFLTCNLTQVMATLKGLKAVSQIEAYRGYALTTAKEIWSQLSVYAKDRIYHVLTHLMAEDISWYQALEKGDEDLFLSEARCSWVQGSGTMLHALKSSETCFIEYGEPGKSEFLKEAKVTSYQKGVFKVVAQGETYLLEEKNVLKSAFTMEEII